MSRLSFPKMLLPALLLMGLLTGLLLSGCDPAQPVPEISVSPTSATQELVGTPQTAVPTRTASPTKMPSATPTSEPLCGDSSMVPYPRADHEMVYDQHREKIILFGGRELDFAAPFRPSATSSRHVSETWEYDQCGWRQIETPHSPPNLDDFDIVYDSVRNATILLGQYTPIDNPESGSVSMMWEYDGQDWRRMTEVPQLPPPRIFRGVTFDPFLNRIALFGGYGVYAPGWGDFLWDTWVFENGNWRDITLEIMYETVPPREFPIMIFDEARNTVVLLSATVSNCTSEFDGIRWDYLMDLPNRDDRPAMEFRRDMLVLYGDMVYDTKRGVAVAHGTSGTWEYGGNNWERIDSAGGPHSTWHEMAYDEARGITVLFGGMDENKNPIEGTWLYDGETWVQE